MMRLHKLPALLAVLATLGACAAPSEAGPSDDARLKALVGEAACSSNDQCHTIAWGAKACGGPQRWVAWSSQQTDEAQLKALAERHAQAEQEDNRRSGRVSTCSIVADQGARCEAQRCVLNNGGAPSNPAVR